MARFINKVHGSIMEGIHTIHENLPMNGTGYANKLWRLKILYNRQTDPKEKRILSPDEIDPAQKQINTIVSRQNREIQRAYVQRPKGFVLRQPTDSVKRNEITIVNPNPVGSEESYQSLVIQGMPSEVEVGPETTWAVIKTVGRNTPFYHFTGAEDTVSFEISWYSIEEDRKDVIRKCRILESWSKNNAYQASPPELWISWGSSGLFKDMNFILAAAPYSLSNFQNAYRRDRNSEIVDLGLIPNTAVQRLTFKKISGSNLTTEQIQSV